jgi:nicotinamide-nucleotide amidase
MKQLVGIAAQIAAKLIERKQTIAVAESSTGGLISAALLAVPGASAYFLGGGVIYTRDARIFPMTP